MSLFLCTSMMLSMLAGCNRNNEDDVADTEESERVAMTLSLWLPTNEGTTEEAIDLAEQAINKLTQAKFDTAIELHAIPRDEYQSVIDAKIADVEKRIEEEEKAAAERRKQAKEEAKNKGKGNTKKETAAPEETVATEETYVDDLGATLVKYPAVRDTQLDIFLVQGYDNYIRYVDEEQIQQLDPELSSTSKVLKTYIYEKYLDLLKPNGTYAIPNNHPIGEYDYLLVNKELVDTYDYDPKSLNTFLKCQNFLQDMAYLKEKGEEPLQDVTLVLGNVDAINMNYWSVDGNWSLLASQITNAMNHDQKLPPKSALSISVYTNTIALMKQLTEAGHVGDGIVDEGEKFAVGVISGDASIADTYGDDYYISVYGKPVMEQDDVYGSMFAVSSYSKSLARSMEIITYLNTSTDIRTILQYGAEGVHWEYDRDNPDVIKILSDDYSMNLLETGNVYMTYPGEGMPLSYWNYGKQQNLDAIVSPYFAFGDDYITEENREKMEELAALSATYKARIDALTAAEFKEQLDVIKAELKENELMIELLDDEIETSPAYLYADFYSYTYE